MIAFFNKNKSDNNEPINGTATDNAVTTPETGSLQTEAPQQQQSMVLRSEGLIKKYGKRTVVNGVSFDVKQGEIVGLLGPNGAGKTDRKSVV